MGHHTYICHAFYLFAIYTPLKKKSPIAIEVGAIAGALPPLIGWVVAAGSPTTYGLILFESYSHGNFHTLWPLPGIIVRITRRVGFASITSTIRLGPRWG